MFSKVFIAALAASPLVAAHGKIAVLAGDQGGNTTGLGIQGGVVPGTGPDSQTEVDTTVFNQLNAASNGLGRTEGQGENTVAGVSAVVAQSGSTLPQVSSSGGSITGTIHIVTSDGAGPYTAIVDPTGSGQFADGTEAEVTTQVPGTFGEIRPPQERSLYGRMLVNMGLRKRAANVNENYPIAIAVPAGTACSGSVGGQSNVCAVKIANPNPAGPFGGVAFFQIAASNTSTTSTTKKFRA